MTARSALRFPSADTLYEYLTDVAKELSAYIRTNHEEECYRVASGKKSVATSRIKKHNVILGPAP